jgi:cytidylate kinase
MQRPQPVVTIDGPASSGKGTVGMLLAEKLHCPFVDTGAMYRALAVRAGELNIDLDDQDRLERLARECQFHFLRPESKGQWGYRMVIDDCDVTEKIRTPQIDMASSRISAYPGVHAAMVEKQRNLARAGGVVMEGRDIGTVVLPDADMKFYLTASVQERAKRRYLQMKGWGREVDKDQLEKQLRRRDQADSQREVAPLYQAEDAVVVDTTDLSIEEVLRKIVAQLQQKFGPEIFQGGA